MVFHGFLVIETMLGRGILWKTNSKNEFLIPRNYQSQIIDSQFSRVRNLPGDSFNDKRNLALKKKVIVNNDDKKSDSPHRL